MVHKLLTLVLLVTLFVSCTPRAYFTVGTRSKIESKSISLDKLQFYVDRDVELRRAISKDDAKVASGKVTFEGGKYVNVISLKQYTPGVCTGIHNGTVDISFEIGDGKSLTFGVDENAIEGTVYQIKPQELVHNAGKVTYDGNTYYIQPGGMGAKLMIKKSAAENLQIDTRVMSGQQVK